MLFWCDDEVSEGAASDLSIIVEGIVIISF
jgi:hypothetical protein